MLVLFLHACRLSWKDYTPAVVEGLRQPTVLREDYTNQQPTPTPGPPLVSFPVLFLGLCLSQNGSAYPMLVHALLAEQLLLHGSGAMLPLHS